MNAGTPTLPPGDSIAFENDWQGTRITLRPSGSARWIAVGFLGFWLCGWATGEFFAVGTLLSSAARGLGMPGLSLPTLPMNGAGMGGAAFLLLWAAFWTFGGVAAGVAALRLGWGKDVLTLRGEEWSLFRGVGSVGLTRRFPRSAVRHVGISRFPTGKGGSQSTVVATVEGKTVSLSSFGNPEEQLWLRDQVRRDCGLPLGEAPVSPAVTAPAVVQTRSQPDALPAGWHLDLLPDGSTRVTRQVKNRAVGVGCIGLFAAVWNGIIWTLIGKGGGAGSVPIGWLFLTPFVLVGLALLGLCAWAMLGQEEWRVDRDRFLLIRSFLGREWVKSFSGGALAVESGTDGEGHSTRSLVLRAEGKRQVLISAGTHDKPHDLRRMGELLSYHTRWPFQVDP